VPIPEFVVELRRHVGHAPLWLVGVTGVVVRGDDPGEVLLVRRADNGAWTPVTGIVDPGEHPADAVVREVAEETGVRASVRNLAWVGVTEPVVYENGDRAQYVDHTFRCHYVSGDAHVADDESTDVGWFPLDDLPTLAPVHLERIHEALRDTEHTRIT
jgi:8-oxo-dGTP pyrophosphatase MutT (NUDIX family)